MPHTHSEFADSRQNSVAQTVHTLKASLRGLPPEASDSVRQHLTRLIEAGERQLNGQPAGDPTDPATREPDIR